MADTPSVLIVKDGQSPQSQQNIGVMVDGSGTKYHQEYLRFDGGVAGAANPFPVIDTAAGTALTSAVALLTTIAGSSGGGGATAALQTTGNTTLGSILTALGSTATTALQTAGNALLTAISGALTAANGYLSTIATAEAAGNTSLAAIAAQSGPFLGADSSNAAPAVGSVLKTATATHGFWAQNQSAVTLQVVLDDGASATPTIMLLGPGAGAGQQGASSDLIPFAGRVRVAGTAGSQFALRVW